MATRFAPALLGLIACLLLLVVPSTAMSRLDEPQTTFLPIVTSLEEPPIIVNGSFEQGTEGWDVSNAEPVEGSTSLEAYDGEWFMSVWSGSWPFYPGGEIRQTITIPGDRYFLHFFIHIDGSMSCNSGSGQDPSSVHMVIVHSESDFLFGRKICGLYPSWEHVTVNLQSYSNQTVQLAFIAFAGNSSVGHAHIDHVYLSSHP